MTPICNRLAAFWRDDDGAAMIEYAVLIGLITVASVTLIAGGGEWIKDQWEDLKTDVTATATSW